MPGEGCGGGGDGGPGRAEPQFNLGLIHQKYGQADAAIRAYRRATELDRSFVAAHYNLAAVYAERGMLKEALAELVIVITLNPNYEKAQEHEADIRQLLRE